MRLRQGELERPRKITFILFIGRTKNIPAWPFGDHQKEVEIVRVQEKGWVFHLVCVIQRDGVWCRERAQSPSEVLILPSFLQGAEENVGYFF